MITHKTWRLRNILARKIKVLIDYLDPEIDDEIGKIVKTKRKITPKDANLTKKTVEKTTTVIAAPIENKNKPAVKTTSVINKKKDSLSNQNDTGSQS